MNMGFPSNEAETIELFRLGQARLGWHIAHLQTAFPDAVIENGRGQKLVAEFEYEAKNFKKHKHPVDGCDLILCYCNNWSNAPLPVWALEECMQGEIKFLRQLMGRDKNLLSGTLSDLSKRVSSLSGELETTRRRAREAETSAEYWEAQAGRSELIEYAHDGMEIDIEGIIRAIPDDFPKWTIPPAILFLIFGCCLFMVLNNGYFFAVFFLAFALYATVVLSIYLHGRQYGVD